MTKLVGNALRACAAALIAGLLSLSGASAQGGNPDSYRGGPRSDRRGRRAQQGHSDLAGNLARRRQRQRRNTRPSGAARHPRRSEHAGQRTEHLHQADHGRQSRPAARPLRHELRRAGIADHHPEQEVDDQLHGDRHQRQVQLRQVFLDGLGRTAGGQRVLDRLLRSRDEAEPEAADGGDPRSRRRVRPERRPGRARGDQEARLQAGV